jgi:hypothetical protein
MTAQPLSNGPVHSAHLRSEFLEGRSEKVNTTKLLEHQNEKKTETLFAFI